MRAMSPTEREIVNLSCPYCEAAPGRWCLTANGGDSERLHTARVDKWLYPPTPDPPEWPPYVPGGSR